MKLKGQATIEYVIILGFAMILAVAAISAFGGIPGMGSGTSEKISATYWQTSDVGITSARFLANGLATITLKNNENELIRIQELKVGDSIFSEAKGKFLNPQQTVVVSGNVTAGEKGEDFSFPIEVVYRFVENDVGNITFRGEQDYTGQYQ